jgi:serine/threonine-protein kinase
LYYSNLGAAYLVLGRYNEAAPMFEKAVALSPNSPLYERNLADAYRFSGQTDKAMTAYDKAIALAFNAYKVNPSDAGNIGLLAICYAKKGDGKQAMNFIGQARAIDPNDNGLVYKEAVIHAIAGRTGEALARLSEALKKGYSLQEATSDPDLKALRDTDEFKRILTELSRKPTQ